MKNKILIPLIAGLALLCACKGKNNTEFLNRASTADSATIDSAIVTTPKLVKTAKMYFKVRSVKQSISKITGLVASYDGMIIHHKLESININSTNARVSNDSVMRVTCFNTNADLIIKIPVDKLQEFMNQISDMGLHIDESTMDITDKSLDYLSARLKLKSRTELVNQQKKGKITIKNTANVLNLKDEMVDEQIANKEIDNAVKYSTVSLSFYESNTISKEVIANDDPSAYELPFFKRVSMAFENGVQLFEDTFITLINLWLFIIIALGCWLLFKKYRVKKVTVAP